jgi:uncharacterized protein (DUF1330 family)
MRCYALVEIDVSDPAWVREYVDEVTPMVERRGGRYLARTPNAALIEGERAPAQTLVIIEWPSREAADEFYESDEYRPFRERRREGARNQLLLIAGEDAMGVARISP